MLLRTKPGLHHGSVSRKQFPVRNPHHAVPAVQHIVHIVVQQPVYFVKQEREEVSTCSNPSGVALVAHADGGFHGGEGMDAYGVGGNGDGTGGGAGEGVGIGSVVVVCSWGLVGERNVGGGGGWWMDVLS